MKIQPSRGAVVALAAVGLLVAAGSGARACALNWSEPGSHFEGVSFQGYVFLVETLGEIGLKDGRKLPVRAVFRSENNSTSPHLGHGWELPLLESHIVQMDERWFRVVEPTGWYRLFWRDDKDPTVLHGQGNWKGVIRANSISVMADCGDRLDFREGRITGMQLKEQKLEIERSPDGTAVLKEDSTTLLAVRRSLSKEEIELKLGRDQTVEIGYADRPLIEVIAGQAVVRQQVKSLGSIALGNGEKRVWEYAVDDKLNPTMTIDGNRLIVWNPASKRIVKDGEWTYDITPGTGAFDNAAIGRKNAKNQSEFWHYDGAKGKEVAQGIDGVKKVTTWFTSGKFAGTIRQKTMVSDTKDIHLYGVSLSEKGQPLRESLANAEYVFDNEGALIKLSNSETGSQILFRPITNK